eukprot:TRINITY_DN18588_c0_g1_i1.p1 TRINITY_DN18588_c0_g1~~TRINITY_DN18588_c0_g1_i1.p1  ORF type:complete len:153 (-),score=12.53 TRINITY_DN18588_c0_g1_i1:1083-1541(-)
MTMFAFSFLWLTLITGHCIKCMSRFKNNFLNDLPTEEIYTTPPELPQPPYHVCRQHYTLHGLKQAPCAWLNASAMSFFALAILAILRAFMTPHYSAYPLMWSGAPSLCYDMLIVGDDQEGLQSLKTSLNFQFDLKDRGHLRYFMRIEVACPP